MVISTTGILLYAKVSSLIMYYGSALFLFTCKLHYLLENKKFFKFKKEGYRDGIKRKETR